jgi:hypothetical protein
MDLFEPQDHPNDFLYPGGPPVAPYDAAGWTLAYTMGVKFDRVLDAFDGPFERIRLWRTAIGKSKPAIAAAGAGYILNAQANSSFVCYQ